MEGGPGLLFTRLSRKTWEERLGQNDFFLSCAFNLFVFFWLTRAKCYRPGFCTFTTLECRYRLVEPSEGGLRC